MYDNWHVEEKSEDLAAGACGGLGLRIRTFQTRITWATNFSRRTAGNRFNAQCGDSLVFENVSLSE